VRAQAGRAAVLALIAGYVDCYSLLNYQTFASFMSGNTTQAALHAGRGEYAAAAHSLLPIPLFVVGVFAGTCLLQSSQHRQSRRLFALVAALLAVGMAAAYLRLPGWSNIMTLGPAMGLMNTAITRVGGQPVSLGYVTGDLNNLAQHLALAVRRVPVPQAQGPWDTHGRRAALLGGLWTAFLLGALMAGAATPRFGAGTLLLPTLLLLLLATFDRAMSADA
jgi:uncharacterized membrane protein YoaK (UPF0700 family)